MQFALGEPRETEGLQQRALFSHQFLGNELADA